LFSVPPGSVEKMCGYTDLFLETRSGPPTRMKLPMPWSINYQNLWKAFLTDLNSEIQGGYYESPDGEYVPWVNSFASIAVGGPTSTSNEMILPSSGSNTNTLPTGTTVSGLSDLVAWNDLLANRYGPSYVNSDQAFIEAWQAAIDMYGQVFSGLTLTLATGAGLPNFPGGVTSTPPVGIATANCALPLTVDCAAEATIVGYFAQQSSGGFNAKLVAQLGQQASLTTAFPLSGLSIEWLTANTSGGLTELTGSTTVLSQMYGGLQFAGDVSGSGSTGCVNLKTGPCPVSPEQGLVNVMQLIFRGTDQAALFGEPSVITTPSFSDAPLNYVQVSDLDVLYGLGLRDCAAAGEVMAGTCVAQTSTSIGSFEFALEIANQAMLDIAEAPVVYTPDPSPPGNPGPCPTPGPSCAN
jgi:hypothetical protein